MLLCSKYLGGIIRSLDIRGRVFSIFKNIEGVVPFSGFPGHIFHYESIQDEVFLDLQIEWCISGEAWGVVNF